MVGQSGRFWMLLVDPLVDLPLPLLINLFHLSQIHRNATAVYSATSTKECLCFSCMHLRLSKLRSIY